MSESFAVDVQNVSKSFWKRGGPFSASTRIAALTKAPVAVYASPLERAMETAKPRA